MEPNALKSLLIAIDELQRKAAFVDDLIATGIINEDSLGRLYDPSAADVADFDGTNATRPDAPSGLAAIATADLVFLSWVVPPFQTPLSHSEVWELNAPAFREDISYVIGDFVTYVAVVYIFTSDHAAGAWAAGDVAAATATDLVIGNTHSRHQTPINSAVLPMDVNGGTSYFWVRLISESGVAGVFSSSIGVEAESKGSLDADHGELVGLTDDDHVQYSLIASGAGVPSSTPSRVGLIYIDTTNDVGYVSVGTASSADWSPTTGIYDLRWDDLRESAIAINPPGAASDPDRDTSNGTLLYAANGTELVFLIVQMPHAWANETEIHPHIHWTKTTSASGDVAWELEYKHVPIGGTIAGTWTSLGLKTTPAITDNDTTDEHLITDLGAMTMTGYNDSHVILFRLSRDGSDVSDTYGADARMLYFDIHYQSDSRGSVTEYGGI